MAFVRGVEETNIAEAGGTARRSSTATRAWITIGFLFFFMLINYADRAVLGLAAAALMKDLNLTATQFGSIGSAFFFCYSISALLLGFVINRASTRWMLFTLAIIWSIAQFPMLALPNFTVLLVSRMLLGAGEGPSYPAAIHAAFKWFPDEKRTLPTSIITQGSAVGVVLAGPAINWIIMHYGWQAAFAVLGVVGIVWGAAWLSFAKEGPVTTTVTASGAKLERVPYSRLLFNPTVLTTWLTLFAAFWALSLLLVWFPSYLGKGLGFSQQSVGLLASLPWAGGAVVILFFGWLSQKLLTSGYTSRAARVIFVCIGGLVGAACLLALPLFATPEMKLVLVCIGIVLPNAMFAPAQAIQGEISPVAQRGAVLAIGNAVASTAGMIAPLVTGRLVDVSASQSAGYEMAFVICGIVVGIANLLGIMFIRPQEQARKLAGA
jgi:ACS family D-galactonate transporter-like MFS transporter